MSQIISAVLIVGGTGLLFGCILAVASVIFKVEGNEKAERILEVLPGANCGGCGYAGCSAYAEAAAEGKAPVNACSVGKAAVAEKIAKNPIITKNATTTINVLSGGDSITPELLRSFLSRLCLLGDLYSR